MILILLSLFYMDWTAQPSKRMLIALGPVYMETKNLFRV